jgi:hypothetical protein
MSWLCLTKFADHLLETWRIVESPTLATGASAPKNAIEQLVEWPKTPLLGFRPVQKIPNLTSFSNLPKE